MYDDFFKGKKVFVTGSTGFKGSYLCEVLTLCGAIVKGFSLDSKSEEITLYNLLNLKKRIQHCKGDIRSYEEIYKAMNDFQPDIVFHMAAQPIVRLSYDDPLYTYETNVMGTVNVLEAIRHIESIKSVVMITTDKVYKNNEWDYGYRENDELCGYDPYSNSKSCADLAIYSYKMSFFLGKDFPRISTVRSGNVIGGGDFGKDRIMTDAVNSYLKRENIIIRNPYSTRPYLYVLDTINGYLELAKKQYEDKKYEGIYNFGPEDCNCVTTGELATIFCDKVDNQIKWINKHDGGPHEANFLKLDATKSKKYLGWKQKYDINKTVQNIVDWTYAFEKKEDIRKITDKQIREFYNDKRRNKRKNA